MPSRTSRGVWTEEASWGPDKEVEALGLILPHCPHLFQDRFVLQFNQQWSQPKINRAPSVFCLWDHSHCRSVDSSLKPFIGCAWAKEAICSSPMASRLQLVLSGLVAQNLGCQSCVSSCTSSSLSFHAYFVSRLVGLDKPSWSSATTYNSPIKSHQLILLSHSWLGILQVDFHVPLFDPKSFLSINTFHKEEAALCNCPGLLRLISWQALRQGGGPLACGP